MNKRIKWLAIFHIITAVNIVMFWIEFYTGLIFPIDVMKEKITHFEGYYAWETSFTIPDLILVTVIIIGAVKILKNNSDKLAHILLIAASGGLIFLGTLDFVYDFRNGMFALGHIYSYILLSVGVFLPPFGMISIYILYKNLKELEG
jgi:hypothetical protein